jgi:hypothetical protein
MNKRQRKKHSLVKQRINWQKIAEIYRDDCKPDECAAYIFGQFFIGRPEQPDWDHPIWNAWTKAENLVDWKEEQVL